MVAGRRARCAGRDLIPGPLPLPSPGHYEKAADRLRRFIRGRPGFRDGNGPVAAHRVEFVTEQAPHPDSRVKLGTDRDALGQRKLEVDRRFTDRDRRSLERDSEGVDGQI